MQRAVDPVCYMRARTLRRGLHGYWRWINRALGWPLILYCFVWLVLYVISGIQLVQAGGISTISSWIPPACSLALSVLVVKPLLRRRVPPVNLNSHDLHRLLLAPLPPFQVMTWPFAKARAGRTVLGLLLGGTWSLFSQNWFHLPAPWAAPGLALLLWFVLNLAWLAYDGAQRSGWQHLVGWLLGLLALIWSLLGVTGAPWELDAVLYSPSVWTLLGPIALAGCSSLFVHITLRDSYPAKFPSHSLILSSLRAINRFNLLTQTTADVNLQQRLTQLLYNRPEARQPSHNLPCPRAFKGAFGATAWRSALSLYRSSWANLVTLLALSLLSILTYLMVYLLPVGGGIAGLVVAIVLLFLLPRLLGPELPALPLPLEPVHRTLGRILPGLLVITGLVLMVWLLSFIFLTPLLFPPSITFALLTLFPLGLVLLEKLSVWSDFPKEHVGLRFAVGLLTMQPTTLLWGGHLVLLGALLNLGLAAIIGYAMP